MDLHYYYCNCGTDNFLASAGNPGKKIKKATALNRKSLPQIRADFLALLKQIEKVSLLLQGPQRGYGSAGTQRYKIYACGFAGKV